MPILLKLPNKELTPQMKRMGGGRMGGGGGGGWCEGEKEWPAASSKVVSSGLWNQELPGRRCSLLCYTPALPPPQHPHLHPHDLCSTLLWLECRLSTPPPFSVTCSPSPVFSPRKKVEKRRGSSATSSSFSSRLWQYAAASLPARTWITFISKVTQKNFWIRGNYLWYFCTSAKVPLSN